MSGNAGRVGGSVMGASVTAVIRIVPRVRTPVPGAGSGPAAALAVAPRLRASPEETLGPTVDVVRLDLLAELAHARALLARALAQGGPEGVAHALLVERVHEERAAAQLSRRTGELRQDEGAP